MHTSSKVRPCGKSAWFSGHQTAPIWGAIILPTAGYGQNVWARMETTSGGRGNTPFCTAEFRRRPLTLNPILAPQLLWVIRQRRMTQGNCPGEVHMAQKRTITVGKTMGKLEWEARFVTGKLRRGSSLTRRDQLNCLGKIGKCMQSYGLNSIKDLKPKHVERYFAELRSRNLSPGRMANHATAMRMLCRMMGKSDIVPSNRELGCARNLGNRTKHADVRMDAAKAASVRAQLSPAHQIAYDLAMHFGLRQKESLLSVETVHRDGKDFLVVQGGKGGRPRQVPVITEAQRAVLAQNNAYRNGNDGKLIDASKSLKQGIRQLQNELAAAGATRNSGANMHTLRREWIIERCQEILQVPEARRPDLVAELVEQVGHGRAEVLRAYTLILK